MIATIKIVSAPLGCNHVQIPIPFAPNSEIVQFSAKPAFPDLAAALYRFRQRQTAQSDQLFSKFPRAITYSPFSSRCCYDNLSARHPVPWVSSHQANLPVAGGR